MKIKKAVRIFERPGDILLERRGRLYAFRSTPVRKVTVSELWSIDRYWERNMDGGKPLTVEELEHYGLEIEQTT